MYVVWVGRGPYFWQCKGCTQPYMRLKDSAVDRSVFPVAGFRHLQNVSFLSYLICILYPFKQLCEHIAAGIKFTKQQTNKQRRSLKKKLFYSNNIYTPLHRVKKLF